MRISNINNNRLSFCAGRANILATADNHGNLKQLPRVLKTIENNSDEIFVDGGSPSTQNFLAIVGDWFINPGKTGFLTRPELSNGDIQKASLIKTVDSVRNVVKEKSKNGKFHFHTLYAMGNHCLDGGTNFMVNVMKTTPVTTLVTNVDLEKSPRIKEVMDVTPKVAKSRVYEIPDDKNPDLKHKILFVSATIPSMDFYNPGLCDGLEFYDNSNKKDANLQEEDIRGTIDAIKKEVDEFKEENPKGVVILLSHMGGRLSEIIQKNVPQINHILNGHDHENTQSNVGKTSINSLGKDNEMIKAISIEFDDKGDCVKSTMTPYFPETTLADDLENHDMQLFLNNFFEEDEKPLIKIKEFKSEKALKEEKKEEPKIVSEVLSDMGIDHIYKNLKSVKSEYLRSIVEREVQERMRQRFETNNGMTELTYGNEIRYDNSYLMNFLTSAIKDEILSGGKKVASVGIPASMVRGGISNDANNLDIMKVFDSVGDELSQLYIGDLKGSQIVDLICENVEENLKAPTRSTLIHWSDFKVDRRLVDQIVHGSSNAKKEYAIRVRNEITNGFEPIDPNETYRIVLPRKYLIKTDIKMPNEIREYFTPLNTTYDKVFDDYLTRVKNKIAITPKIREVRVIK